MLQCINNTPTVRTPKENCRNKINHHSEEGGTKPATCMEDRWECSIHWWLICPPWTTVVGQHWKSRCATKYTDDKTHGICTLEDRARSKWPRPTACLQNNPPKILHGIKAVVLCKKDILPVNQMYKKMLKQIQGLTQNTADEYVYTLIGSIPLEGQIHQKIMSLFGNICRFPKKTNFSRLHNDS